MLAFEDLTDRYTAFADEAKAVLNIRTEADYKQAQAFMAYLQEQAEDGENESLHGLMGLVTNAMRRYERNEGAVQAFEGGDLTDET